MDDRAELIRLKLTGEGLGDLYEQLQGLAGIELGGRFVLREPYDVGGQSILWLAEDRSRPGQRALARLVLLPYHRPAYLSKKDIQRARRRIEREAGLMGEFRNTCLPELYGLFRAHNPLQAPERGDEVTESEPFLVMEWISGETVLDRVRRLERVVSVQRGQVLGWLALDVIHSAVHLSCVLADHRYLYADFNPRNMILPSTPSIWPVRVVDAGSIIPASPAPDVEVPFSWAYIPIEYYHAYQSGRDLWPTLDYVLYTLGKTLWQVLTNRQPMPGEDPAMDDRSLLAQPEALVNLVRGLVNGSYSTFDIVRSLVDDLRRDLLPQFTSA